MGKNFKYQLGCGCGCSTLWNCEEGSCILIQNKTKEEVLDFLQSKKDSGIFSSYSTLLYVYAKNNEFNDSLMNTLSVDVPENQNYKSSTNIIYSSNNDGNRIVRFHIPSTCQNDSYLTFTATESQFAVAVNISEDIQNLYDELNLNLPEYSLSSLLFCRSFSLKFNNEHTTTGSGVPIYSKFYILSNNTLQSSVQLPTSLDFQDDDLMNDDTYFSETLSTINTNLLADNQSYIIDVLRPTCYAVIQSFDFGFLAPYLTNIEGITDEYTSIYLNAGKVEDGSETGTGTLTLGVGYDIPENGSETNTTYHIYALDFGRKINLSKTFEVEVPATIEWYRNSTIVDTENSPPITLESKCQVTFTLIFSSFFNPLDEQDYEEQADWITPSINYVNNTLEGSSIEPKSTALITMQCNYTTTATIADGYSFWGKSSSFSSTLKKLSDTVLTNDSDLVRGSKFSMTSLTSEDYAIKQQYSCSASNNSSYNTYDAIIIVDKQNLRNNILNCYTQFITTNPYCKLSWKMSTMQTCYGWIPYELHWDNQNSEFYLTSLQDCNL